jgi:predicted Rossmann fold flavoprotein
MNKRPRTLIVIGGGAAGFFCAVNAARLNSSLKVIILEKTTKLLTKVKVSGGGRCNVTHACFDIGSMINYYPRGKNFVKKMFYQFFTSDTIQWFKERGVILKTEADGRMFPVTDSSQTIIDCLMGEINKYGVEIMMNSEVRSLKYEKEEFVVELSGLRLPTSDLRLLTSDFVCIASGGYPKSNQFDWIRQLGHSIEQPVPSLFTFNIPHHPIVKLMGVSVEGVEIKILGTRLIEKGPVLITHWGLSGPTVLRLSAWGARQLNEFDYDFTILINWLSSFHENSCREFLQTFRITNGSLKLANRNPFDLPQRLWEFLLKEAEIDPGWKWNDLPGSFLNKFVKILCSYQMRVNGKTTYKEEFVTAGGIRLTEIDASTMKSKIIPGLYLAGEILDVDGITGGFNFQHAWSSGWIAGKSIALLG